MNARVQLDAAPVGMAPPGTRQARPRRLSARSPQPISLIAAALLVLLVVLQALSLWRAPVAWFPAAIRVQLAPGAAITLGQHELAAPQADATHLGLRRDAAGAWWLRNLSAGKQVLLQRPGAEQHMGSADLAAGQAFQVGDARFEVVAATPQQLTLNHAGQRWRYDGATLYRDGRAQPSCSDAGWAARAMALWNRATPGPLTIARPLSFGGNVYCSNRLGLAGVTAGAATLARLDGRLQLAAGNPDGPRAALLLSRAGDGGGDGDGLQELRRNELPLAGLEAMVVGRTRFIITNTADQLTLTPGGRVALFSAAQARLPQGVSWEWRPRTLWRGQAGAPFWAALAVCGAALAGALLLRAQPRWQLRCAAAAAAALCCTGVATLLAQRAGHAPDAAYAMLLGGAALVLWLALPGRLALVTAAGLVLLAAGQLTQLAMGLGGMESSWLRYYQKTSALLALGSGLAGLCVCWSAWRPAAVQQRRAEWLLALLAGVALMGLAAEVIWGDETGVFDLQPVELAKLALAALTAHCLALRLSWRNGGDDSGSHGARWLRLIGPALLFLALMALALVQVDDFSPLILLLVWSASMALAYALVVRHWWLAALLGCALLLGVAAIVYLRSAGSDALLHWGFYADRFQVWLDPATHPHTGQQLLLGARAIGAGGLWGSDQALGMASLGQPLGAPLRIPAVQDDFAPALFMYRHGLVGALLLWGVQAAFLTGLAQTAGRACAAAQQARHFRLAWLARYRYFALCGGGAFVLGHFLLSWGTNLAIFPIMGQPMSFLSVGGSHLLFFLIPLLAFGAISELSFEENASCRSMSSTKS